MNSSDDIYEVGERVQLKLDGVWHNATVVNGYRTHDGVINVVLENGSPAFCGDSSAIKSECIRRRSERTPAEAMKDFADAFCEGLSAAFDIFSKAVFAAGKILHSLGRRIIESFMTKTERHYYLHAKKARVKNKYYNKAKRRLLLAFQ